MHPLPLQKGWGEVSGVSQSRNLCLMLPPSLPCNPSPCINVTLQLLPCVPADCKDYWEGSRGAVSWPPSPRPPPTTQAAAPNLV